MTNPKLVLRPPPNRGYMQGYPGIAGKMTRPDAHYAGSIAVTNVPKHMTASSLRVELSKIETVPGGKSWTEFIGTQPVVVWRAADGEGADDTYLPLDRTEFDFSIPIPRQLPPSMQIDKNSGIKYRLVATMYTKIRRGLFRKEDVPVTLEGAADVVLPKYEMLSTWPVFNEPCEYVVNSSYYRITVMNNKIYYAVGEPISLRTLILSRVNVPKKVKGLKVSLMQTRTYMEDGKKITKEILLESKSKSLRKKLRNGEVAMHDFMVEVPRKRTLIDVDSAEHIHVSHHVNVQLNTEMGTLVVDKIAVRITPFTEVASAAIMDRIGSDISLTHGGRKEELPKEEPVFLDPSAGANQIPTSASPIALASEVTGMPETPGRANPAQNQFAAPVSSGAYALPGSIRPGEVVRLEPDSPATTFSGRPASSIGHLVAQPSPPQYRQSMPPHLFASETEKQRLFDNARSEARAYQAQFDGGVAFAEEQPPPPPPLFAEPTVTQRYPTAAEEKAALGAQHDTLGTEPVVPAAEAGTSAGASTGMAASTPAYVGGPRYPSAAEEKEAIYNRAQDEVRAFYAEQANDEVSAQHAEVRPIEVQLVEAQPLVAQSAEVEHAEEHAAHPGLHGA